MAEESKPEQVGEIDITKKNSAFNTEEAGKAGLAADAVCYWNGRAYSQGARICDGNHHLFRCDYAGWTFLGSC